MGKKKKKNRSKFERSIDHRNWGFDARDAMFEQMKDTAKTINRQIITKKELNDYTEEEIMAKAGEITTYNYNNVYTWKEFKAMPERNKREYISHLRQKYKGLRVADLGAMFGVSYGVVLSAVNDLHITFPRGGYRSSEGRTKFMAEMIERQPVVYEEPEPEQEQEDAVFLLHSVRVTCEAKDVSAVLASLGMNGLVEVSAQRKEVV